MNPLEAYTSALTSDFYAESYQLRRAASTMTSAYLDWFQDHCQSLVEEAIRTDSSDQFCVLSIGSGEGDLDLEMMGCLLTHLNQFGKKLIYIAVEPNSVHRSQFWNRLKKSGYCDKAEIHIKDGYFGDPQLLGDQTFHLVMMVQVLYYFPKPFNPIKDALSALKANGRVVIVHQEDTGIPELQRKYMGRLKGHEDELLTIGDIREVLAIHGQPYDYDRIDAYLDTSELIKGTEDGIKIMSFCLECDLRQLPEEVLHELILCFKEHSTTEEDGPQLYEPIGVILLSAADQTEEVARLPSDKESVQDYWKLATLYDWSSLLKAKGQETIRVLDVACGSGRWLEALALYVDFPKNLKLNYSLLDPNQHAVSSAAQRLSAPFYEGSRFISYLQNAQIEDLGFDIIWSMHGFYTIPIQDLPLVLGKLRQALGYGGQVIIGMPTRNSFYVDCYAKYLAHFEDRASTGFTSAEDIIKALNLMGADYDVDQVLYEEEIECSDFARLEHYIFKESIDNSFATNMRSGRRSQPDGDCLKKLLSDPKMGGYLGSWIQGDHYHFIQDVRLISFGA